MAALRIVARWQQVAVDRQRLKMRQVARIVRLKPAALMTQVIAIVEVVPGFVIAAPWRKIVLRKPKTHQKMRFGRKIG